MSAEILILSLAVGNFIFFLGVAIGGKKYVDFYVSQCENNIKSFFNKELLEIDNKYNFFCSDVNAIEEKISTCRSECEEHIKSISDSQNENLFHTYQLLLKEMKDLHNDVDHLKKCLAR